MHRRTALSAFALFLPRAGNAASPAMPTTSKAAFGNRGALSFQGRRMRLNESVKVFLDFAAARNLVLKDSTPRAGIEAMLAFRAVAGCIGCSDDVLLFQWGTYDWGQGKYFELDITRQFVEEALRDDDAISQLSLTYRYAPRADLDALGFGNRWEEATPDFRKFIFQSAAFVAVADIKPVHIELNHTYV